MGSRLCACGRPVSAGWTARTDSRRCLICHTERVMRSWQAPRAHRPTVNIWRKDVQR